MAAAKPPKALLIDCPPSRHDGERRQQQRRAWRNCQIVCRAAVLALAIAAFATGLSSLIIFLDRQFPSKPPVYTAAVTGVAGLDVLLLPPPLPSSSTSSPSSPATFSTVFNLTFQIDNTRNAWHEACVPGLSRAEVSYGDAFLAGGSVPPFCAGEMRASGAVEARAWGESVAVPRFLRVQLAAELAVGDASVDVKVTMPGGAMLSCKPKIGDGTYATCRLDHL